MFILWVAQPDGFALGRRRSISRVATTACSLGRPKASNTSVWASPRFEIQRHTGRAKRVGDKRRPTEAAQSRFISVSVCRRLMVSRWLDRFASSPHLPGAYSAFVRLMSQRPRLHAAVAARLGEFPVKNIDISSVFGARSRQMNRKRVRRLANDARNLALDAALSTDCGAEGDPWNPLTLSGYDL